MKILQINKYITLNGGSETVMKSLDELFNLYGYEVFNIGFHKENQEYVSNKFIDLGLEKKTIKTMFYNRKIVDKIVRYIVYNKIDVVICHNVYHHFPVAQLFQTIKKKTEASLILYLHDYKIVCPTYSLLCSGQVCESCRNKKYYNAVKKKCKDNSKIKSFILTCDSYWNNKIKNAYSFCDKIISPSAFLANKVKELDNYNEIFVLHNPIKKEKIQIYKKHKKGKILYAGRLSEEKGISKLLEIFKSKSLHEVNLMIAGEGPLKKQVIDYTLKNENITYLGFLSQSQLKKAMDDADYLIIPSICYENNPMIVIEAMKQGLPVIGSTYGGIPELLTNKRGIFIDIDHDEIAISQIKEAVMLSEEEYEKIQHNALKFIEKSSYGEYYKNLKKIME